MSTPKTDAALEALDVYVKCNLNPVAKKFWVLVTSRGWYGPFQTTGVVMNRLHTLIECAINEGVNITISSNK